MGRFHHHAEDSEHRHDRDHDVDDESGVVDGHGLGDHSGYDRSVERMAVLERILDENDRVANANRDALRDVPTVNLMSAPGAGKTTLLRRTIPALAPTVRVGILEGDIATSIDADALSELGAEVSLVNTSKGFGGECHLDAVMVASGLSRLPLDRLDLLIIENVGNLVCPAEFDVGQDVRAMVYAVTEGEDKPLKYPVMFRSADVIVVNKIDLVPHLDFDRELFHTNLRRVNPTAELFELSARTDDGVDRWLQWLRSLLTA